MNILLAPDSFKGSLSAIEVADAIAKGILEFDPSISCIKAPIADGGEGSLAALKMATGCQLISAPSTDPLGRKIQAQYGLLPDRSTAIIEMATTSGLPLLKPSEYNPSKTSTYGTGLLIRHALDQGIRHFIIAIGGSATNDGGAGMAQALGASLLDKAGDELAHGGATLGNLHRMDMSSFDIRVAQSKFEVACDVTNPLCGPEGASFVFGPQKGATPEEVKQLDFNLSHYAEIIEKSLHINIKNMPGAGAAGGLGAGLVAFCHAELKGGFELIAKAIRLEDKIEKADLILAGEGSMDAQTLSGKAPFGVAQLGKKYGKPVYGIAGILGKGHEALLQKGFTQLFEIKSPDMSVEASIQNASELISQTVKRILSLHFQ
ncbi:glycerate kinase [Reichenbachiella ulvae]|uniref:Glycerate kinase n=1 Tax=Reichenbachiella ulvae TaxID=2980104 RepID=A0ABT3CNS3_9BACT|nr:glycerate kinase [Reichenbachiella ulvae]MCV9385383.1 glycerate kinase [Reichenbachiella ulvae]